MTVSSSPNSQASALSARRYRRLPDLVTRQVAGETLVVPIRGRVGDLEAIFTLNETGSVLWSMLDQPATDEALTDALCEEYDVTRPEAEEHVREFLEQLQAAGLVTAE